MDVTMKIATSKEPAKVAISGAMTFNTVAGLDKYLKTVRTARNWLAAQKAGPKPAPTPAP